jgi:hypothetical protein
MNPIPLTGPDGTVYCFACSTCGKPWSSIDLVYVPSPVERAEHIARYRDESRWRAERCCHCMDCGDPLVPTEADADGMVSLWSKSMCRRCIAKAEEKRRWNRFGWAWGQIADAIARGITTEAEWNAQFPEEEDE